MEQVGGCDCIRRERSPVHSHRPLNENPIWHPALCEGAVVVVHNHVIEDRGKIKQSQGVRILSERFVQRVQVVGSGSNN